MSKISIAILIVAAFIYAVWLVLLERKLPDLRMKTGLKRRFILAVLLFAGMLMNTGCRSPVLCYRPAYTEVDEKTQKTYKVIDTISAAWKVLDADKGEEFRNKLEECVKNKNMDENVSKMLTLAYSELSQHKMMTRNKGEVPTCYKPTVLGFNMQESNETALKQIELLRAAKEKGTIDDETAKKVAETLSRELQFLSDAKAISDLSFEEQKKFLEKCKNSAVSPGGTAISAAQIIVEIEKE
ncbi:MAG TPA: hypothetical protein DCZ94_00200 [Lentisphaeria bacterium]|nr:MAG: hypothetical protein A2X48_18695 [Lentisphaerae bacterium GWF2_49_21]HBC85354.1 hypothetical protein [Lentisphaeria bacterium]